MVKHFCVGKLCFKGQLYALGINTLYTRKRWYMADLNVYGWNAVL